jgi:hypothetical protein
MKKPLDGQLSLGLFFDTEVPTAAGDSDGALSIAKEISAAMNQAIKDCGLPREEIADRMGKLLGQESISKHILDAYTSISREAHKINLQRAIAFDAATGLHALLELYAKFAGGRVFIGRDALLAELGRAEVLRDELSQQIKRIKNQMEV